MICERTIKLFCKDDILLIENYDKAISDKTQTWHCHHRGEILCCGRFSREELKRFNLYYNRPACELIFLTNSEHVRLHTKGKPSCRKGKTCSAETKRKISEAKKNMSDETKIKMSKAKLGNTAVRGTYWYNNGKINTRSKKCPEGFVKGRIKK